MGYVIRFFSWLFKGLRFLLPLATPLFTAGIYAGAGTALYVMIDQSASLVSSFSLVFNTWADDISASIVDLFSEVSSNSIFSFFAYILSLDVVVDWFRSCADTFIRSWLIYIAGFALGLVEACVVILGVVWLRKRIKMFASGLFSGDGGGVDL